MNYHISKPCSALSPYVKHYWSFEHRLSNKTLHTQRIIPTGLFEVIFYLDEKPNGSELYSYSNMQTFISGQMKGYHDVSYSGRLKIFAIYFYPHGLSMFLDIPLNELFNNSIPAQELLNKEIDALEDRLSLASDIKEQITVTEEFLLNQLHKKADIHQFDRIQHTIHSINKSRGKIDINELAREVCLSRKQFERIFLEMIGTSPKQFLKIVRFQHAIHQKSIHTELSMTEIAYACGYYDQAHMINDFKTLSGLSPGKFFGLHQSISDYFG